MILGIAHKKMDTTTKTTKGDLQRIQVNVSERTVQRRFKECRSELLETFVETSVRERHWQ